LPEIICNTSPLQYLHQLGLLHLLPALAGHVTVPPAVADELAAGRALGISLPDPVALDWISIRQPISAAVLPLVTDLGPGETEVMALALESPGAVIILDDGLARQVAETLGIRLTGTLGVLLDAKRGGLVPAVAPLLDQLQNLRFRLAPNTRDAVLKLAGETP
jgi:predicted nucleic acid-binding protein